jgi:threonine synthase
MTHTNGRSRVDSTALPGKTLTQRCLNCGRVSSEAFTPFCETCGGMVDIEYDLDRARLHDSTNPLERFFDLLPVETPGTLLPQEAEYTPCIHATRLGAALGLSSLYLKDETVLPTGTTKYRMAVVSLAFLSERGSAPRRRGTVRRRIRTQSPVIRICGFTCSPQKNLEIGWITA